LSPIDALGSKFAAPTGTIFDRSPCTAPADPGITTQDDHVFAFGRQPGPDLL